MEITLLSQGVQFTRYVLPDSGHESMLGKSQYDKTTITGIGAYVKVLL